MDIFNISVKEINNLTRPKKKHAHHTVKKADPLADIRESAALARLMAEAEWSPVRWALVEKIQECQECGARFTNILGLFRVDRHGSNGGVRYTRKDTMSTHFRHLPLVQEQHPDVEHLPLCPCCIVTDERNLSPVQSELFPDITGVATICAHLTAER